MEFVTNLKTRNIGLFRVFFVTIINNWFEKNTVDNIRICGYALLKFPVMPGDPSPWESGK
jgi:hypothetical protein